ncbi:GyrI-like domain-containing protein [Paenibacillus sp. N3.4]|uniref:GyrI-like domain-containing protein n=1 Tax=Paenibacillus sp. N3.4 TaxID=2603222 RepID=UPI0011CA08F9|nr:GyrI-like domain-containing protein [Paenibacillus sp. N3.4]TXK83902.1 AraC family transcriptional regulator [Paenibacillus sp. N3.4]
MIPIQPTFKQLNEFQVTGISARTTNAQEMAGNGVIPKLWQDYYQQEVGAKIPHFLPNSPTFGLYTDYESDASGSYLLLVGLKVAEPTDVAGDLVSKTVPASRYAIFTTAKGPAFTNVAQAWVAIWDWFAHHPEIQRTFTGDFELYDERTANPLDAEVDIYIAIQE